MKTRTWSVCATFVFFTLLFGLALPETAHAGYIDSGSGSALVQVIIAATAGIAKVWHSFCRTIGIRK